MQMDQIRSERPRLAAVVAIYMQVTQLFFENDCMQNDIKTKVYKIAFALKSLKQTLFKVGSNPGQSWTS